MKIPDDMSDQDAATQGVALVTMVHWVSLQDDG